MRSSSSSCKIYNIISVYLCITISAERSMRNEWPAEMCIADFNNSPPPPSSSA